MVSFQALKNGNPITVTGAGLNQEESMQHSFFDVYFQVDLGGGNFEEGALGLAAIPPNPVTTVVTGAGAMSFHFTPGDPCAPGDPCRVSKFFLDPLAFESFNLTLQTDLTLPGDAPPLLSPNTNVVPEPRDLLLLAILTGVLVASHRRGWCGRRIER